MRKKCKRSKNRILVTMLAFFCLFSQFSTDVEAAAQLGRVPISFEHLFPPVYGSLDNTLSGQIAFKKTIVHGLGLSSDYKYLIYGNTGRLLTTDFKYDDDRNNSVTSYLQFSYAGNVYDLVGPYLCIVVDGAGASGMYWDLNVIIDYHINPYNGNDGYIYQNEFQSKVTCNGEFVVLQLDDDDYPLGRQLSYIYNYLLNSPDLNGENSATIIARLTDIMNSNAILQSKVSSMYDLLVEVYGQDEADKVIMDNFQENSSSQSSELDQLNQENQVEKIDIDSATSTVDANIDMNAIGNSGVVLSALTGENKILVMMLGVSAIALVAYVFFGKR